jgi:hypothetical protein
MSIELRARRIHTTPPDGFVFAVPATAVAQGQLPIVSNEVFTWPTAETTGATGSLTPNTSDYLNSNDAVYEDIHFTYTGGGSIQCVGDNVTFTNCRFASHILLNEVDGCTLTDCTFDDGFSVSSSRLVNLVRAKIENIPSADGIHITNDGTTFDNEDITIQDCYIYNLLASGEAHADGIQVRGSVRLEVLNCYIDLGPYNITHNAAFYAEGLQGGNVDMLIDGNYFKTGNGYTLYIHSSGDGGVFSNNTIAPGAFGYQYAPSPLTYSGSGNVDENGDPYDIYDPPA